MALRRSSDPVPFDAAATHVCLLGGFSVRMASGALDLAPGCQRLLAFLGLGARRFRRSTVAGTLWPDSSEVRAHASLRSTLARLQRARGGVVDASSTEIGLADAVTVDFDGAREAAYALLRPPTRPVDADAGRVLVDLLSTDLLPGWYDDWVLLETESWRQLRLHALEVLSHSLAAAGHFGDATLAALAAVTADPLRESAHAALITVHLAEGNRSEALRSYAQYRTLLARALGIEPTRKLRDLVDGRAGTSP